MSSIPSSLKLVNASEVSSVVVSRRNTTIYPTGGQDVPSSTNGGQVIEFKIPVSSNESVDMSTFFMHFNFQITNKSSGTVAYIQDSIESIIDELTVFVGNTGQELERIRGYNRLESSLNNYISSNFVKSVGSSMMACGLSRDERREQFSNGTNTTGTLVQMSVPLRLCGVANPDFIMPSQIFGQSSFLILRVRLASPASCIVCVTEGAVTNTSGVLTNGTYTAGTAQYALTNIRASFDFIQTSQEYQNQMSQFLASSSLVYPVKTWDVDFRTVSGSITENLSYNYRDIEAIFFWFNLQSELNNFGFAGEDRLHVPINISSLQLTVNGSRIPSIPIDLANGASEALTHTLVALGALHIAEGVGPFNYDRVLNLGVGSATSVVNTISYINESGSRFYGRERTAGTVGFPGVRYLAGTAPAYTSSPVTNPLECDHTPSYFLVGLNMRKLLDLPEGELSGLNLQNTSGSVGYELKFTSSPGETYSMGVAVLHNRFITLSGAGMSVDI